MERDAEGAWAAADRLVREFPDSRQAEGITVLHPERGTDRAGADLEFNGIPAYVLVGPDGVVIAEGEGAFTGEIEAAVEEHFGAG